MRAADRRRLYPITDPQRIPLTADHMAEALLLAAVATGELAQFAKRAEAMITGQLPFRGRWVALAALLALHQEAEISSIAWPLGCGVNALRQLASTRGKSWFLEEDVQAVFVGLVDGFASALPGRRSLQDAVGRLLAERSEQIGFSGASNECDGRQEPFGDASGADERALDRPRHGLD